MLFWITTTAYLWAVIVVFIKLGNRAKQRYEKQNFSTFDYIVRFELPHYTATFVLFFGWSFLMDAFTIREVPYSMLSTIFPILSLILMAGIGYQETSSMYASLRKEAKLGGDAGVADLTKYFARSSGGLFVLSVAFIILGKLACISLVLLLT